MNQCKPCHVLLSQASLGKKERNLSRMGGTVEGETRLSLVDDSPRVEMSQAFALTHNVMMARLS